MMYQSLREVIAEESDEDMDVSFTVKNPDGTTSKFNTLDEFHNDKKSDADWIVTENAPSAPRRRRQRL